jgi:hypothetical protein
MSHQQAASGPPRALPRALCLGLAGLVALAYAAAAGVGWLVVAAVAAVATAFGAMSGLAVRDSRERVVPVTHSLGDAMRRVVRVLWY